MVEIKRVINTDVLVIGGGGAAVRAALAAEETGAQVLLVTKGELGHSGTTAFEVAEIAGYNAADGCSDSTDSPAAHFQDIMEAAIGTCDPKLAKILAEEAPLTLKELESWGVKFEMKEGRHLAVEGCFGTRPRMHIIKGHSKPILDVMIAKLKATSIVVHQQTMVIDLLVEAGACLGALVINSAGEFIQINAGSVVLATGGAGQLFQLNLNPADVTGDGYAIALRSGAELVNMEFMQMGLGLVYPVPNILNCWVWYLHPKVLNKNGVEFLNRYLPVGVDPIACMDAKAHHFPFSSRDLSKYIEVAIIKEINNGGAGLHGGVFLDFRQIDCSKVAPDFLRMWETTKAWLLKLGLDTDSELLEVAPFGHAINGGLNTDENGATNLNNLFAAGEVAGGAHGADRLGGNMIVGCQVFGRRAGRAAAQKALTTATANPSCSKTSLQVPVWCSNQNGQISPVEFQKKIQVLMSSNFLIVRTQTGLAKIIETVNTMADEAQRLGFRCNTVADTFKAFECRNMINLAIVMAGAALRRQESRGSHYRDDFPETLPEWESSIISSGTEQKINHHAYSWINK